MDALMSLLVILIMGWSKIFKNSLNSILSLSSLSIFRNNSLTSSSVGFSPIERVKSPNSAKSMLPSPLMSNLSNSSLKVDWLQCSYKYIHFTLTHLYADMSKTDSCCSFTILLLSSNLQGNRIFLSRVGFDFSSKTFVLNMDSNAEDLLLFMLWKFPLINTRHPP